MEETSHIVDRKRMRSQTLDLLRFPLAVVVLLIHTFGVEGLGVNGRAFEPEQYPLFVVVRDAIEAFLGGQSVPVYFFISGYVFFLGVEWTRATYARKLKNRLHTLLIPYVLWNTIALMLLAVRLLPCFRSYLSQPEGAGRTDVGQRPVLLLGVQRRPERDGDGHHRAHRLPAVVRARPHGGCPLHAPSLSCAPHCRAVCRVAAGAALVWLGLRRRWALLPVCHGFFLLLLGSLHEHRPPRHAVRVRSSLQGFGRALSLVGPWLHARCPPQPRGLRHLQEPQHRGGAVLCLRRGRVAAAAGVVPCQSLPGLVQLFHLRVPHAGCAPVSPRCCLSSSSLPRALARWRSMRFRRQPRWACCSRVSTC